MNNQIKEEGLTDAYLLGKYDGIKQGRADAIDECIALPTEKMFGIEYIRKSDLEQIKNQNNTKDGGKE